MLRAQYQVLSFSHHPVCFASTPPVQSRCIATVVRRLECAQAHSSKPRLTLGQEGSTVAHPSRRPASAALRTCALFPHAGRRDLVL
jgi:hypothetical protein